MGKQDELKLIEIKNFANTIKGYEFVIDKGNFDTSIMISEKGEWIPCSTHWTEEDYERLKSEGWRHWVPDIIDYHNKVIIEYQESAKKTGKHTVKGHDELSDADKDLYYQLAGFYQIKIWDYDEQWKPNLRSMLTMVSKKKSRISE